MSDEILAVIEASGPRRWLAIAMLVGLGGMLIYLAFTAPAGFAWQAFLLLFGAGCLWVSHRMNVATKTRLELTRDGFRDSEGALLAEISDIKSVSRGMLAFKPSNGFTLVLSQSKGPARWQPGLWWKFGKRVGVGGVTSGGQTKATAQIIEALIMEQRPDAD